MPRVEGKLLSLEVQADAMSPSVRKAMEEFMKNGKLGNNNPKALAISVI